MIEIRPMQLSEVDTLANLWLDVSIKAHDFIPSSYWKANFLAMKEIYLPNAEVYVASENNIIVGFLALIDNHIASIFVASEKQGRGIGKQLIAFGKDIRSELSLNVYQKNEGSVIFYQRNGFEVIETSVDEATQEAEFVMKWCRI